MEMYNLQLDKYEMQYLLDIFQRATLPGRIAAQTAQEAPAVHRLNFKLGHAAQNPAQVEPGPGAGNDENDENTGMGTLKRGME